MAASVGGSSVDYVSPSSPQQPPTDESSTKRTRGLISFFEQKMSLARDEFRNFCTKKRGNQEMEGADTTLRMVDATKGPVVGVTMLTDTGDLSELEEEKEPCSAAVVVVAVTDQDDGKENQGVLKVTSDAMVCAVPHTPPVSTDVIEESVQSSSAERKLAEVASWVGSGKEGDKTAKQNVLMPPELQSIEQGIAADESLSPSLVTAWSQASQADTVDEVAKERALGSTQKQNSFVSGADQLNLNDDMELENSQDNSLHKQDSTMDADTPTQNGHVNGTAQAHDDITKHNGTIEHHRTAQACAVPDGGGDVYGSKNGPHGMGNGVGGRLSSNNSDGRSVEDVESAQSQSPPHDRDAKLIVAGAIAHLKWYRPPKGFGFLTLDQEPFGDLFFHRTNVFGSDGNVDWHPLIHEGDTVRVDVYETRKGMHGFNITAVDGEQLPGKIANYASQQGQYGYNNHGGYGSRPNRRGGSFRGRGGYGRGGYMGYGK